MYIYTNIIHTCMYVHVQLTMACIYCKCATLSQPEMYTWVGISHAPFVSCVHKVFKF